MRCMYAPTQKAAILLGKFTEDDPERASYLRIEERVPERGTRRAPVDAKTWVPNPPSCTPLSGRSQRPLFFCWAQSCARLVVAHLSVCSRDMPSLRAAGTA